MKKAKFGLVGMFICILILLPETSLAGGYFYMSIRSGNFCRVYHRRPFGYCKDYYWRRIRRDYFCRPRYYFCCRRPCLSRFIFRHGYGPSVWVEDYWREPIIVEKRVFTYPPEVVFKKKVTIKRKDCEQEDKEESLRLFERLRLKKKELLKKLKIGNKENRKKAIKELAGFSFDKKVREELEKILLSDPDPELRREVAWTFGKTKNKQVLSALEKARIEDPDREVRRAADKAIKEIDC